MSSKPMFWLCLVACWGITTASLFNVGVTEFDLIFPRNDTFTPMQVMPVVFAVQNPRAAKLLRPGLDYGLGPVGYDMFNSLEEFSGANYFDNVSANDTTTIFIHNLAIDRVNTEGTWIFWWRLQWINCSITDNPAFINNTYGDFEDVYDGFHISGSTSFQTVIFTTHQGGRQPNLTAISSGDNYENIQSLTFDVVDNLHVPPPMNHYDEIEFCPLLATAAPRPTPASLNPEVISNITRAECYFTTPASSCWPKRGHAGSLMDRNQAPWIWITMACAWLLLSAVVY